DPYEALENANALLLLTEWKEFRLPSWKRAKELMKDLVLLDGRNIYDGKEMRELGFYYEGIGTR
ncbi:MAG: UDP binding domain-containing protein, partial [Bacteroidales bacterium]|nr:UDP binding domain-containing protein [Bacteroidales bacterium]